MDHIAAAEERLVNERLRQKLNEVNAAAQEHLAGVQDHINFTLQVFSLSSIFGFWDFVRFIDFWIVYCSKHTSSVRTSVSTGGGSMTR